MTHINPYMPGVSWEERDAKRREQQLKMERENYQRQIQQENLKNLRLQNAALSSSIQMIGGRVPGQVGGGTQTIIGPPTVMPQSTPQPALQLAPASASSSASQNFPSLAEIQSMIESSQRKAQEDFQSKIDLLQTQERQKEEEDRLNASNAAARRLSYERIQSGGAWESALRGR